MTEKDKEGTMFLKCDQCGKQLGYIKKGGFSKMSLILCKSCKDVYNKVYAAYQLNRGGGDEGLNMFNDIFNGFGSS